MTKNEDGLRRDALLLLEHKDFCSQDEFEQCTRELARDYGLGDNGEVWDYLAEIDG